MGTLSGGLNIALQAMLAAQAEIATTSSNIANANTPGYSRQTVEVTEAPPVQYGGLLFGNGVQISQITSQRDTVLQMRLDQETQQQGQYSSFLNSMQQVQSLFNETGGTGLQSSITGFFNSLQQLSTNPTSTSLRQGVLSAAGNMTQVFSSTSTELTSVRQGVDESVAQSVSQINSLSSQIAQLNSAVSAAEVIGQNPGTLVDQRTQLVNQLAGVVGISEVNAGNGNLTITTSNGTALVVGNQNYQLTSQADAATGLQHVYSQNDDITSNLQGGALGGNLQVRDTTIPAILSSLDALASNIETSVNSVNQAGTDLNGDPGGSVFAAPPAGGAGAAAKMAVVINDPSKIATSLDGSGGDNANVNAMIALQNQPIVNGQTPLNSYANLILQIGNSVSSAQSEVQGTQAVVQQLQSQIGSVSGVSINEEAANLVKFQQAYEAAAQVASIINTLAETAIHIGSTNG